MKFTSNIWVKIVSAPSCLQWFSLTNNSKLINCGLMIKDFVPHGNSQADHGSDVWRGTSWSCVSLQRAVVVLCTQSAGETRVSCLTKWCPVALSRAGLMHGTETGWLQCQMGTGTLCSFYLFILTGRQPCPLADCQSSRSPAVRSTIIKDY